MSNLLTPKDVAERLKISVSQVSRLVKGGKISAYRIGGSIKISEEDLNEYLQSRYMKAKFQKPNYSLLK